MVVQDDKRERELINLFALQEVPGRSSVDAILKVGKTIIPFELKSTTADSVTTVRDFGPAHITKWKDKHWLIGFYNKKQELLYCRYGSPKDMSAWIYEKELYIKTDFELANYVPSLIDQSIMFSIIGKKKSYTLEDARQIHKRQYSAADYRNKMDLKNGYSRGRMLDILRDRCRYIIERGSTLNNPHIPGSYLNNLIKLRPGNKKALMNFVLRYLKTC